MKRSKTSVNREKYRDSTVVSFWRVPTVQCSSDRLSTAKSESRVLRPNGRGQNCL